MPGVIVGSPLQGIPATSFQVEQFSDIRGVEPRFVGYCGEPMEDTRSVVEIVTVALSNELRRTGHSVISADSEPPEFSISGSIHQCWLFNQVGAWKATVTAQVVAKIKVKRFGAPEVLLSKTYRADHSLRGFTIRPKGCGQTLNEALLGMVREFTTDEEFLALLR